MCLIYSEPASSINSSNIFITSFKIFPFLLVNISLTRGLLSLRIHSTLMMLKPVITPTRTHDKIQRKQKMKNLQETNVKSTENNLHGLRKQLFIYFRQCQSLQEIFTMKNKTNILQLHFHRFCLLTTVQLQQEILAVLSTYPCLELAVNSIVDEGLLSACFDLQNLKVENKPVRFFAKRYVEYSCC